MVTQHEEIVLHESKYYVERRTAIVSTLRTQFTPRFIIDKLCVQHREFEV
jgi:hypothetical protein